MCSSPTTNNPSPTGQTRLQRRGLIQLSRLARPSSRSVEDSSRWLPAAPTCLSGTAPSAPFFRTCLITELQGLDATPGPIQFRKSQGETVS